MIEKIKQEVKQLLECEKAGFEELETPSKNNLFLVNANNTKYILKIYKECKDKENLKSFAREKKAIEYFSLHLDEVKPLITSGKGENPWLLIKHFEGPSLKSTEDFELYKKAIELMIKLHSLEEGIERPSEIEILGPYDKKLQEVRERVKKYLPEKFDREFLISLVDNFYLCYKYIYEKSTKFIHGDFVDRNILVNEELNLIDFENSRIAPLVEDLIFFIETSKLENSQKRELISQYKKEIDFDEKIFLILTLLTKLRILGSLLRIKKDSLEKINEGKKDENIHSI
jgi:Ser/Thr protein kinase RdoA (MazF antagonist)